MPDRDTGLKQLSRYARIARNSQILLVWEPSEKSTTDAEAAREAIVQDAFDYLNEVLEGVESPYFTPGTRQDRRYIDLIAVEKIHRATYDPHGIFVQGEEAVRLKIPDASEAQAARFAYLAASCMRIIKTPFYLAPGLRISITSPANLAEFVNIVGTVKDVTLRTANEEFHKVVQKMEWRTAFAFWEANRWLAGTMSGEA